MTQSRGEPLNRFTNNEENRFRACSSWQGSLGRTLLSRTGRAGAPQPVAVGRGSPFFQKGLYLSMNHHHHHHHPRLLGMGYVGVYIIYYNIYIIVISYIPNHVLGLSLQVPPGFAPLQTCAGLPRALGSWGGGHCK